MCTLRSSSGVFVTAFRIFLHMYLKYTLYLYLYYNVVQQHCLPGTLDFDTALKQNGFVDTRDGLRYESQDIRPHSLLYLRKGTCIPLGCNVQYTSAPS